MPKGRLDQNDFILFHIPDGAVIERLRPQNQPSAETAIHGAIYRMFPDARACLHGHSVAACVAGSRARPSSRSLRLPPLEMLKGFDVWKQNPKIDLPLFENALDVKNIAREIASRFDKTPPALTALMVRDHGATVWGKSVQDAYNRFECLDFLFSFLAAREKSSA
jgi:methylthioribulose-1-phosphate dehydratase